MAAVFASGSRDLTASWAWQATKYQDLNFSEIQCGLEARAPVACAMRTMFAGGNDIPFRAKFRVIFLERGHLGRFFCVLEAALHPRRAHGERYQYQNLRIARYKVQRTEKTSAFWHTGLRCSFSLPLLNEHQSFGSERPPVVPGLFYFSVVTLLRMSCEYISI